MAAPQVSIDKYLSLLPENHAVPSVTPAESAIDSDSSNASQTDLTGSAKTSRSDSIFSDASTASTVSNATIVTDAKATEAEPRPENGGFLKLGNGAA